VQLGDDLMLELAGAENSSDDIKDKAVAITALFSTNKCQVTFSLCLLNRKHTDNVLRK